MAVKNAAAEIEAALTSARADAEREVNSGLLAEGGAPAEPMTEIDVLSEDGSHYVKKSVTVSEAESIRVSQMVDRSYLSHGGTVLNTDGYDQSRCYYLTHENPAGLSTTTALQQGYRPVDPAKCGPLMPGHQVSTVTGWNGKVVKVGDLVLMEIPRHMKEANDAAEARYQASLRSPDLEHRGNAILDAARINDGRSGVVMSRNGQMMTGMTREMETYNEEGDPVRGYGEMDRAAMMAESHQRAHAYKEKMEREAIGQRSFGGFDGPMNRGAIPDSRMNIAGRPARQ